MYLPGFGCKVLAISRSIELAISPKAIICRLKYPPLIVISVLGIYSTRFLILSITFMISVVSIDPFSWLLGNNDEVFLLDVNVAKKYAPDQLEDTKLLGTLYYAAPEQVGFGHGASTPKTDIYALGVLLNVLITGKLPKEEKAKGEVWVIVDRCIKLDPEERYSDEELLSVLNTYLEKGV